MGKKTPEEILNDVMGCDDWTVSDLGLNKAVKAMTEYGNQQWNAALEQMKSKAVVVQDANGEWIKAVTVVWCDNLKK